VSVATASRVVTGVSSASPAARRKVQDAVAALSYVPHPVARHLAQGRGHRLVVAIVGAQRATLADPYVARVTTAAAEVAGAHGIGVGLRRVPVGSAGVAVMADLGRDRGVAAVVLVNHTAQLLNSLPAALIAKTAAIGSAGRQVPGFDVDSPSGVTALLRHLRAKGRRQIVLVTGPPWVSAARRPLEAYRAFMQEVGLPVRTVSGDFSAQRGRTATQRALHRWPGTDAIIALSDAAALGALAALAQSGRAVPKDVAVAGFDDVPLAALVHPGLTTATHPVEAIAATAAQCALAARTSSPGLLLFPSTAVLRHSA
jgi:DNA-binding LacI/PurR family transcriptional regulator